MTKEERFQHVLSWFAEYVGAVDTELHYNTPYELLVAVMLSAQCTDKRVNMTTPALFARFPDPASLAAGTVHRGRNPRPHQVHFLSQQQGGAPPRHGSETHGRLWRRRA